MFVLGYTITRLRFILFLICFLTLKKNILVYILYSLVFVLLMEENEYFKFTINKYFKIYKLYFETIIIK